MNSGELRHKIAIQIRIGNRNDWVDYYNCHAKVNISSGQEFVSGGAIQSSSNCIFTVRYCEKLKDIFLNSQNYRIIFRGGVYDIQKTDNYMFLDKWLQILAMGKAARV